MSPIWKFTRFSSPSIEEAPSSLRHPPQFSWSRKEDAVLQPKSQQGHSKYELMMIGPLGSPRFLIFCGMNCALIFMNSFKFQVCTGLMFNVGFVLISFANKQGTSNVKKLKRGYDHGPFIVL